VALNYNSSKNLTIAVLFGGLSAERDISIQSGTQVSSSLKKLGYNVADIDVGKDVAEKLKEADPELAFIALHGPYGEDGTIQGLLEILGIKYTGSGVLASALGIDKCTSKKIFASEELPTPRFIELISDVYDLEKIETIGFPVVVKPNCQGSSVGISIARDRDEIKEAINDAFKHDSKVLIEEFIDGREIQCGIIGNDKLVALEPIEIISKNDFFDFEAKYDPTLASEIVPAQITQVEKELVQERAIKAYKALGCRGFARVDTFLKADGSVLVSEINTVPGLTENSLFPKEAIASGYTFDEMIQQIVNLALD
jgi:D-alanine-D-alanine ligase